MGLGTRSSEKRLGGTGQQTTHVFHLLVHFYYTHNDDDELMIDIFITVRVFDRETNLLPHGVSRQRK